MATSWMKAKTAKMKRDGIAQSRGICPTFSKTERDAPSAGAKPTGWNVVIDGTKFYRGLPRTFGPFATEADAKAYLRRSRAEGKVYPIGAAAPKPAPTGEIPKGRALDYLVAEHVAHNAAQLELSRATREALGKRTVFPWTRR